MAKRKRTDVGRKTLVLGLKAAQIAAREFERVLALTTKAVEKKRLSNIPGQLKKEIIASNRRLRSFAASETKRLGERLKKIAKEIGRK